MLRIIFKFILYFIIIYYLFRLVDKAIFGDRKAMERERRKNEKEKERLFREYRKREGKVTIQNGDTKSKRFKKNEGEYVDYEEVK